MNRDPLTEKAEKVAKEAITHSPKAGYMKVNGPELFVRDQIVTFASPRIQRDFILALRVAMLNFIQKHRLIDKCTNPDCQYEKRYEDLKFVLLDELDARSPQGIYNEDLTSAQIQRMEQIRDELLDAIRAAQADALEGDRILLGAFEEGFDEIRNDRATKATNTGTMIRKYVEKFGERIAGKLLVDPMLEEITKALN